MLVEKRLSDYIYIYIGIYISVYYLYIYLIEKPQSNNDLKEQILEAMLEVSSNKLDHWFHEMLSVII